MTHTMLACLLGCYILTSKGPAVDAERQAYLLVVLKQNPGAFCALHISARCYRSYGRAVKATD